MHNSFTFKGIVRDTDELYARDGECSEVVNMRFKGGSAVPVMPPETMALLPCRYKSVYRHEIASVYMCILEKDGAVHIYDDNSLSSSDIAPVVLSEQCVGVHRIEFIGNIACFFTEDVTMYAIYDTGQYKWLGERPIMPSLNFTVESQVYELTTEDKFYYGTPNEGDDISLYWDSVSIGYFDECIAKLNKRGLYIDRVLYRYAFRMFDGTYAYFSPIYYLEDNGRVAGMSRDEGNFYAFPNDASSGKSLYTVSVQGFKVGCMFENYDLSEWENLIMSIDIFCSGSIMGHKVIDSNPAFESRADGVYITRGLKYNRYAAKNVAEIYEDVLSHSLFYKVAEYNLKGECVEVLDDVSTSSLALCATPGDDAMSLMGRTASYTYVFNGMLHLANIKERFFKGYSAVCYAPCLMERVTVQGTIYTELKTKQGTVVVKNDYGNGFVLGFSGGEYYLAPYLVYPDSRASKLTFVLVINDVLYRRSFVLSAHKTLNLACYLHDAENGYRSSVDGVFADDNTKINVVSRQELCLRFGFKTGTYNLIYSSNGSWMYGDTVFADSGYCFAIRGTLSAGDKIIVTIWELSVASRSKEIGYIKIDETWSRDAGTDDLVEQNVVEQRENVLKVSATDNPFCFPAAQTYMPSESPIVALCSNTVALSQGQFGQHPLYLFCGDGIWVMTSAADGDSIYSTCHPLSREVCINPSSVRGIDSGVVFITSKGLMYINGGEITLLSSVLDSSPNPVGESDIEYRIAALCELQNVFDGDSFLKYSANAVLGYSYSEREIIISNSSYHYSYVLSLDSGMWYKATYTFHHVANSYPQFLGVSYNNDSTCLKIFRDEKDGENDVLLISRPLLWGTKQFKRVIQAVLHASVYPAVNVSRFSGLACYLLCSNDGVNFKLLSGCERRSEFRDVSFPFMPTQSYRYFAVAVVGNIMTKSRITALELAVNAAWNKRLN